MGVRLNYSMLRESEQLGHEVKQEGVYRNKVVKEEAC